MSDKHSQLVEQYLQSVRQALGDLRADRRDELLADLREHIAANRAYLGRETSEDVRAILERLGDPAAIASAAHTFADAAESPSTLDILEVALAQQPTLKVGPR